MRIEVWRQDAACRGVDTTKFFDYETDNRLAVPPELAELCDRCPVVNACFVHALKHEAHGWWAHTTAKERAELRIVLGIKLRRY